MGNERLRVSYTDSPEKYHSVKALSNSGISILLKCEAKFKHWLDHGIDQETSALRIGSLFHCLTLEPEKFNERYHVKKEDGRMKAGKNEIAAVKERSVQVISRHEYEKCLNMGKSVASHSFFEKVIRPNKSRTEVSIYWSELVAGVEIPCKARIDIETTIDGIAILTDIKSTNDADPEKLPGHIYKYGYHRQGAWYIRAYKKAFESIKQAGFFLFFVEKSAPYITTCVELENDALCQGDSEIESALLKYAQCYSSGVWPDYTEKNFMLTGNKVMKVGIPDWINQKEL